MRIKRPHAHVGGWRVYRPIIKKEAHSQQNGGRKGGMEQDIPERGDASPLTVPLAGRQGKPTEGREGGIKGRGCEQKGYPGQGHASRSQEDEKSRTGMEAFALHMICSAVPK